MSDEEDMDDAFLGDGKGVQLQPPPGRAGGVQIPAPKPQPEHAVFFPLKAGWDRNVHAVEFDDRGRRIKRRAARQADEALEAAEKKHAEEIVQLKQQLRSKDAELEIKNRELARREQEARERQALATTDQRHRHEMDTLRAELDARKAELEAKKLEAQQARDSLEAERKSRDEERKDRAQRMAEEKAEWQVLKDKQEDARKQQALQYQRELNAERQAWIEKKAELDALKAELDRKQTFDLKLMELASRGESEAKKGDLQKELEALRAADKVEERKLRAQLAAEAEQNKSLQRDLDRARAEASEARKLELEQAKMEAIQELQRDKQALERQVKEAQQELARERLALEKQAADARAEQIRTKDALDMASLDLKKTQMDRAYELQLQKLQSEAERDAFKRKKDEADQTLQREAEAARRTNMEKLANIQLELAQIKSEDAKAAAAAAAEAREAQKQRDAAAAVAQTEKFAFERRKKEMETTILELKAQAETAKAERERAKMERDALKEERELQIRAGAEAWKRMREEMLMRFQEGKEFDARRVTEAKLRRDDKDEKLAGDIAKKLAQGVRILRELVDPSDLHDANVDMIADGDPDRMEIDVASGVTMATTFLEYVATASKLVGEADDTMYKVLKTVLPEQELKESRQLPRLRETVRIVLDQLASVRSEMTIVSKPRRDSIPDPFKKAEAERVFREGSFKAMFVWFAQAALRDPMHEELTRMWFRKAQGYEARFFVARAVLLAVQQFVDTRAASDRYTQPTADPMETIPTASPPSKDQRAQALSQAFSSEQAARLLVQPNDTNGLTLPPAAAAVAPHVTMPLGQMMAAVQNKLTTLNEQKMETGGKSDQPHQRRRRRSRRQAGRDPTFTGADDDRPVGRLPQRQEQPLKNSILTIIEGVRRHLQQLRFDEMWEDASQTAFGDFTDLVQFTQEWAYEIHDKLRDVGVQSTEAAVLTAVTTVIEAFEKVAAESGGNGKPFQTDVMLLQIQNRANKIVDTAKTIRNEQSKGLQLINDAIYDTCIFWNEYFPFNLIDALTAGWAAVRREVYDVYERTRDPEQMWYTLQLYEDTIKTQFTWYTEKLVDTDKVRDNNNMRLRGSPLIQRRMKDMDRQLQIVKQRELLQAKMDEWQKQINGASKNSNRVINAVIAMTNEMRYMVGGIPASRTFGPSPLLNENVDAVVAWLKEWQDAAKDGYRLFQTAYKQFTTATSDLWDSVAAQELKDVFTEDISHFVEVGNILTVSVSDLKAVQTSVAQRLKTWRDLLKTGVANNRLIAAYNDVERQKAFLVPYLKAAEIWTSDAVAAYLDAQIGAVEKKLAKEQKAAAAKGAESGPDDGLNVRIVSNQLTLYESSRPTWRFAKVLEFVKLLAGQVPVVPDSIVDMSVVLVGHPEVRKEAAFAHLADGTAEKETAALRLMEGTALAQFEREQKSIPAATDFGIRDPDVGQNAEVEQKAKEEAEQDDNMRVARIGEAILQRIEALRDMLSDPQRFDEALLGIMTPYGAASVLTSWHVLQKSSRLYEKRSLAQMICAADLRIRTQFAKFCANQYNATDKRRPTRHAHGIDFANEINIEYDAIGKFLITEVRWNPAVRDADDCRASPWIICRATS